MQARITCIGCDSVDHDELSKRKRKCQGCGKVFYVSPAETTRFTKRTWWALTVATVAVIFATFAVAGLYAVEGRGKFGLIFVGLGILFAIEEKERVKEAIQNVR